MVATQVFLVLLMGATVVALADWRIGVFLALVFGSLQDPIRKQTPDTPVILVLACVPIWLAVFFGALVHSRAWTQFRQAFPRQARLGGLFALALVPPVLLTAFGQESNRWPVLALGTFGYVAPLVATLAGFVYVRRVDDLQALLRRYCVFGGLMLTGTLLERSELWPESAVLGTAALGARWIRYAGGSQIDLLSGYFRSPDVMSWHAASLVMLSLSLFLEPPGRRRGVWLAIAAWSGLCLLLGGRRKMMMMPVVWCCLLTVSVLAAGRVRRVLGMVVAAVVALSAVYLAADEIDVQQEYYAYAISASADAPERLWAGWTDVWTTFRQSGVWGEGIGAASHGTRHLSGEQQWQESGPAKVMVELGLPGLVCAALLAGSIFQAGLKLARQAAAPTGYLVSLLALSAANAASFFISHQAYGDPLIMITTAFLLGVALSGDRWEAPIADD